MQMKIKFPKWGINVYLPIVWLLSNLVPLFPTMPDPPSTAILLNANKVNVKRVFYRPYRVINKRKSPFYDLPTRSDYYDDGMGPEFLDSDSFHIEPDDAVDDPKYSPPVIESHPKNHFFSGNHPIAGRPSSVHPSYRNTLRPILHPIAVRPTVEYDYTFQSSVNSPVTKGYKHLDAMPKRDAGVIEATVTSDYKIKDESSLFLGDAPVRNENDDAIHRHLLKNNFTDTNNSQTLAPSDVILNYQPPPVHDNESNKDERHLNNKHLPHWSRSMPIPTTTVQINYLLPDNNTVVPFLESETLLKNNQEVPTYLGTVSSNISAQFTTTTKETVNLVDNDTVSTPSTFDENENVSNAVIPVKSSYNDKFSSGAVAGIVISILCGVTVITSSVIYLLYRRCNGKCTSVVESKFNSDNCGYLDDSLRSSVYLNNHIELPKENSEEMTSLDNDSFLNSLETMTIQNYWADTTKNTKV